MDGQESLEYFEADLLDTLKTVSDLKSYVSDF
jgi:hypothetical protein